MWRLLLSSCFRAYSIFGQRNYEATMMVAALRGTYHMEGLAGADLIMSIHPKYQKMLLESQVPCQEQIGTPIALEVIHRLEKIPEFVRAYEPDGMKTHEFITYGVTQRTLTQFDLAGWSRIGSFAVNPYRFYAHGGYSRDEVRHNSWEVKREH